MLDQTVPHIRIVFRKRRCGRWVVAAKDDQGPVGGLGEGASQNQFAAPVRGIGQLQMFFTNGRPPLNEVFDYIVKECVVSHLQSFLAVPGLGPTPGNSLTRCWIGGKSRGVARTRTVLLEMARKRLPRFEKSGVNAVEERPSRKSN